MEKMYTVAIIGVGARGGDVYGSLLVENKKDLYSKIKFLKLTAFNGVVVGSSPTLAGKPAE